jgi:hypothetical protein
MEKEIEKQPRNKSEDKLHVIKRDGKKELVAFDKITKRLKKLCAEEPALDTNVIDCALVTQKVCSGLHPGKEDLGALN